MAAIIQIAKVPGEGSFCGIDPEKASPAELVASFTDKDLNAAARETSKVFNGLVLARALVIVQARTRCFSLQEFGDRIGVGRNAIYRMAKGKPVTNLWYERTIRLLALELFERGVH